MYFQAFLEVNSLSSCVTNQLDIKNRSGELKGYHLWNDRLKINQAQVVSPKNQLDFFWYDLNGFI